jgi:CobQ-like glutamine amidotransferase family enzyme
MLRLIWIYPDLLSTYGDRGNALVLERRARLRGIPVEVVSVNSDQPVPREGDIYLMGGGEDLPQILAANRLRAGGGLAAAVQRGAVLFAVCAGYQLLGTEFGGSEGEPLPGLGLLDIRSGRGDYRAVGEILADVEPGLGVGRLTGFENHQGVTAIGRGARPLSRVVTGTGNGDGTEGAYSGRVLGTYLHGPALVRNPALADLLLSWVAGPLRPLAPEAEELAQHLRAERLAAVTGAGNLVDEGAGVGSHYFGDEGGGAGDPDAVEYVVGFDRAAGGALGAQRHRAGREHRVEQVLQGRGVQELELGRPARQREPGGFAGQPQGDIHTAGDGRCRDRERLIAAFRVVLARGDLDHECHEMNSTTLGPTLNPCMAC